MIDLYKPVRLRSGRPVRNIVASASYPYPLSGEAMLGERFERCLWTREGRFAFGEPRDELNPYDLLEVNE